MTGHLASGQPRIRRLLYRAVQAATIVGLSVTAAAFFGRYGWLPELFSHFRLQMAAGSLLLLLLALSQRARRTAAVAAFLAAVNLSPLLPYLWPGPAEIHSGQTRVRVLVANVGMRNGDYHALLDLIEHENPDIVGILEAQPEWVKSLQPLQAGYPFSVLHPEEGAYGLAFYSRLPLRERADSPYIAQGVQTAIILDLELPSATTTLILAHLMAPLRPAGARLRNVQIDWIAETVKADSNDEQIILGDLNITPWSPRYRPLQAEAKLRNAARGFGYRATWPVQPAILRIPIDHCLISSGLRATSVRTGWEIGSDHLPLMVDLEPAK